MGLSGSAVGADRSGRQLGRDLPQRGERLIDIGRHVIQPPDVGIGQHRNRAPAEGQYRHAEIVHAPDLLAAADAVAEPAVFGERRGKTILGRLTFALGSKERGGAAVGRQHRPLEDCGLCAGRRHLRRRWPVDRLAPQLRPASKATVKIREGVSPVKVATGEMCQNRIMFKQFIMRGAIDVVQINSCRLGGVNEILAVMLMAAKYNLPVCPHAGGVGLCEYVQHLSMIDYVCIAGTREGRVVEYVDHLHEHFKEPCVVKNAAYMPPRAPGFSIEMKPATLKDFQFAG